MYPSSRAPAHAPHSRRRQHQPSRSLALLLLLFCGCAVAEPHVRGTVSDRDMGIHSYDSIVHHGQHLLSVRVQLRFVCGQPGATDSSSSDEVDVHGFVALFPLSTQPPVWTLAAPHYLPVNLAGASKPDIRIVDRASGISTQLAWVGPADGLWKVEATLPQGLPAAGPFQLHVAGADVVHNLPQPLCQPLQSAVDAQLGGGLWNVLTTTSDSSLDPATLALLVLEHNAYHRKLGFSGTLLRSNRIESAALLRLPEVEAAVQALGLVVWPWEGEHIASASTHYWQKPKNQLSLLGMFGRGARLAYFDLDEYLVINTTSDSSSGSTDVAHAVCGDGTPLLPDSSVGTGSDGRPLASWVFIRFQAKSCPQSPSDIDCWRAGAPFSSGADVVLQHDVCPMASSHGKPIMLPERVDTLSVHAAHSRAFRSNAVVDPGCAHLLHFFSLLESRRPGVTGTLKRLPPTSWNVDPATGERRVVWPPGLVPLGVDGCHGVANARAHAVRVYKQQQHPKKRRSKHGVT